MPFLPHCCQLQVQWPVPAVPCIRRCCRCGGGSIRRIARVSIRFDIIKAQVVKIAEICI